MEAPTLAPPAWLFPLSLSSGHRGALDSWAPSVQDEGPSSRVVVSSRVGAVSSELLVPFKALRKPFKALRKPFNSSEPYRYDKKFSFVFLRHSEVDQNI